MAGVSEAVRAAIAAGRTASSEKAAAWREGMEYRALAAAFAGCPVDCSETVAACAEKLLAEAGWVEALLAPLVGALADDPFFEPPLRLSRDANRTGAVLFECPAATVTANVVTAMVLPECVTFTGRMVVTRYVRGGGAILRRWRADPGASECQALPPVMLADGAVHRCDGRSRAQMPADAVAPMVTLAVSARAGLPLLREYRLSDHRLERLVSADERASRAEMLLTFLRLSNRTDAGQCFDGASRDGAFHLRWAAMREWLALDARAALPRLEQMAGADPHDEVRAAAVRTLATVRDRLACPA